jgi:hypothetical protein
MTGAAKTGWLDGATSAAVAAKSMAASMTASFLLLCAGKTFFEAFGVVTLCYRG